MPNSQQLYLENLFLQLSAHYPHDQPKNWLHAFVAKMMHAVDIAATYDPKHFSSTPIYQNFVQLCSALHPQGVNLSHISAIFNQLFQIDLDFKLDLRTFREKILPNQHRLQYLLIYHPTTRALSKYEVRSFFIFDNKLITLQLLCCKSQTDLPDGKFDVIWQIDYLLESYHLSKGIEKRFHNKSELFNIHENDSVNRLHCVQIVSVINNNVKETDIAGISSGATGMKLEYLTYPESRYMFSELPTHKYLVEVVKEDLQAHQKLNFCRVGRDLLYLFEENQFASVNYNYTEKMLHFRVYDNKNPSLAQYEQHKLTVNVELSPVSRNIAVLTMEIGRINKALKFLDGIYIRISPEEANPVVLVNVIRQNVGSSFTYELLKRSTLPKSAMIDERVYQKLSSLLVESRLDVVLRSLAPQIKWEDYCFVNTIDAIYFITEESDVIYGPSRALTAPKDSVSIADLDQFLADTDFCPKLSQRFIDTMVKNVGQCSLSEKDFTQPLIPVEEAARAECIGAYVQGLDKLMADQRHEFMQLQNNRRNKLECESHKSFMQIHKKYQESYLQIIFHLILAARNSCELELFSEFQQLLFQFMPMHQLAIGEQLERRRMETAISQDRRFLSNLKSFFFETLEAKRETVMQYALQRRAMVDAEKETLAKLQCDNEQRRALQTLEADTRAHLVTRSLYTLDNLWRFNSARVMGQYTQAQLYELGNRTHKIVAQYVDILKAPCTSNRNGHSILETLFLAEDEGWDVFMGGSASRGSPWAKDLDIKLSPSEKNVTDEQRFKLFLILQALLDGATDVRGYPEKGLITFDIPGLRLPVNVVIYMNYKGQYFNAPLYTDDVVVRIKREPQAHLSSRQRAVDRTWLQFYRHCYHPTDVEQSADEIIDLITVGHILQMQHIHGSRFDPPGILRVLREIAYSPEKEHVNAEPLKALIPKMLTDASNRLYQGTLYEFYEGKHKVAPAYFQAFLRLLKRYDLPECSNQPSIKPQPGDQPVGHFFTRPTRYGAGHLIELLVERYQQRSDSTRQLTVLECIEKVLERQERQESFTAFRDFAPQFMNR